jgi:hypothetical protein
MSGWVASAPNRSKIFLSMPPENCIPPSGEEHGECCFCDANVGALKLGIESKLENVVWTATG